MTSPTEAAAIVALVRPIARQMERLGHEGRITLLCGLLAQEVCNRPAAERRCELEDIIDQLPGILRATEDGMRKVLADNARRGL